MANTPIDTWNSGTFDGKLTTFLKDHAKCIEEYHRERKRLESLDPNKCRDQILRGSPFSHIYQDIKIQLSALLCGESFRFWHYTRLVDFEIDAFSLSIDLSTPATMKNRLAAIRLSGHLSQIEIDKIISASAFVTQLELRTNCFYCVDTPIPVVDPCVQPLLRHWGGEVVYSHIQDCVLQEWLKSIGSARVLELRAQISCSKLLYILSESVLNTSAMDAGFVLHPGAVDICIKIDPQNLHLIKVNTEGETCFNKIGIKYPTGANLLRQRYNKFQKN